jgi:hypothetical protein
VTASLLREFYLDILELGVAPPALSTIVISHILKPGKSRRANDLNDHRPISCFSILGKVVQNALRLHIDAQVGPLQGPTQFADNPGASAEMAAFCISSILSFRKGSLTLVLFVDIKGAYDITWKAALKLKMSAAGLHGKVWSLLHSMISSYPTHLKVRGELSELIQITVGLAQGSPLSGFAFTAFLDDLTDLFERERVGVEFVGFFLVGIFLMDDLTIFCPSEKVLLLALELLVAYSQTWRLQFAEPPKSGVMVMGDCTTTSWMLGDMPIFAVKSTKILGVTFSDDLSWTAHVDEKIAAAQFKFKALTRNGLVGGDLSLNAATLFVSAIIWPSLHYGRVATSIYVHARRRTN